MIVNNSFIQSRVRGGVGITPPSCTNSSKSAEIDWLTVTTDKIKYKFNRNRYSILPESHYDLSELFKVLTADKEWFEYDKDYGRNNYKESITIGQDIKVFFYGPCNSKGNHTTMIDLSGSACDEFLERGGDWITLIKFFMDWEVNCSRFDFAIDDFSGQEINPYKLYEDFTNKKIYFKTPYRTMYPMTPLNLKLQTYQGFGLYFGTRGKNQLVIYDKKLEQEEKDVSVYEKVWFRYEMRFTGGKATTLLRDFLIHYLDSQESFNNFAFQCLFDQLDIKDVNPNDSNYRRWKTNKNWIAFLDDVKRMRIVNNYKPKQSIESKRKWISTSVIKSLTQLFLIDDITYFNKQLKQIGEKLNDLKDTDIELVNNYLKKHDKPKLTKYDIKNKSNELLKLFKEKK